MYMYMYMYIHVYVQYIPVGEEDAFSEPVFFFFFFFFLLAVGSSVSGAEGSTSLGLESALPSAGSVVSTYVWTYMYMNTVGRILNV